MSSKVRITLSVGETGEYYSGRNAYRALDNIFRYHRTTLLPGELLHAPRWKRAAFMADHVNYGRGTMQVNIWREPRRANNKRSAFVKANMRNGVGKRLLTKQELEARRIRQRHARQQLLLQHPELTRAEPRRRVALDVWEELDLG